MVPIAPAAPATLSWRDVALLFAARLVLNTAFRILYPLLPFVATGLAIDLRTASLLITVQVGATLLSPLGGALADTRGERPTLTAGLILFCLGTLICALATGFGQFLLGYALIGLAKALFQPAVAAYASARTSYAERGRVLGILEISWALAALVGVTTLTRLVELRAALAPAFWVLCGMGLLMLVALHFGLPAAPPRPGRHHSASRGSRLAPGAIGRGQGHIVAALLVVFGLMFGAELVFVVYAAWLETTFGATTEQLGLVFGSLGFVEMAGSLGVVLLADRLGKRRALLAGLIATAIVQALLPLSAGDWVQFLLLFLLFGLSVEFTIVATFPLLSELAPAMRGLVMALGATAAGLGRVVGSLVGPRLWEGVGFAANGLLAAGLTTLAAVVCLFWVREGGTAQISMERSQAEV